MNNNARKTARASPLIDRFGFVAPLGQDFLNKRSKKFGDPAQCDRTGAGFASVLTLTGAENLLREDYGSQWTQASDTQQQPGHSSLKENINECSVLIDSATLATPAIS
jgi:hypothetical protein